MQVEIDIDKVIEESLGWDLHVRAGGHRFGVAPILLGTLLQMQNLQKASLAGVVERRREVILPLLRPVPEPGQLDDLQITVVMTAILQYAGEKLKNLPRIAPLIGEAIRRQIGRQAPAQQHQPQSPEEQAPPPQVG